MLIIMLLFVFASMHMLIPSVTLSLKTRLLEISFFQFCHGLTHRGPSCQHEICFLSVTDITLCPVPTCNTDATQMLIESMMRPNYGVIVLFSSTRLTGRIENWVTTVFAPAYTG